MEVRYHWTRKAVRDGVVWPEYCPTAQQAADYLTKPIIAKQHLTCSLLCGLQPIPPGPPPATSRQIDGAGGALTSFDAEGRLVKFEIWLDDLHLFLQLTAKEDISLYDHALGHATAPAATADSTARSQWQTRDAHARFAIRNSLPIDEREHFGQHKTAQALYTAVVARYSSPASAALGRLSLPYLFPELASFHTVADLITHLRTSEARFRAAMPDEFLAKNPPPLWLTLYHCSD
ncbi:unnamed protein product [Closterium sp. NIES-53]